MNKKSPKTKNTRSRWTELERDNKGRWVKKNNLSTKSIPPKRYVSKPQEATEILDSIEKDFEKLCPRCAGDMKSHMIRCGPDRLVKVQRCNVCNFWLPQSSSSEIES